MADEPGIDVEIRWSDVDAYGHVSHIALIGLAEHARSRWLDTVLEVKGDPWPYVVVHLEVDFRAPAAFAEHTVRVRVRPTRVGNSSVTLCEIVSGRDGRVLAELETVVVAWEEARSVSRRLTSQEAARLAEGLAG